MEFLPLLRQARVLHEMPRPWHHRPEERLPEPAKYVRPCDEQALHTPAPEEVVENLRRDLARQCPRVLLVQRHD